MTNIIYTKNITICDNETIASQRVAHFIANEIKSKQANGLPITLGLATGNTPKMVYEQLVRMHKNEGLSFKNVISFNLDEYYPLEPSHPLSYHQFMDTHLFGQVDILPENVHIPNGTWQKEQLAQCCEDYDKKILDCGGIDIQLLGIGRNGHIGFNEPGSAFDSPTRLIDLHSLTRNDAAADFEGLEKVPLQAVTMGIQSITQAKKIILLALGSRKADIIQKAFQEEVSPEIPATFLRTLSQVAFVLDKEAAALIAEPLGNNSLTSKY
ncbi:MAG TPA: glucosamine-6-phosphate deaminase [Flavobacterium sp.]|nr:glucosamine-6-phosphate deaminase [Flavobacterium sp.]